MIYLYTAREDRDKEKFLYGSIKESQARERRNVFVIVPDQYTLDAEEQALKYMGGACLFDVEITSMRRFGRKLLSQAGMENTPVLSADGRYILLYKLVNQYRDQLQIFQNMTDKSSYIEMLSSGISDFKQQNCSPEEILGMLEESGGHQLLAGKLKEICLILEEYEKAIKDKYIDNEDYIDLYTDLAAGSPITKDADVWLYGFDTISPKSIRTIGEIAVNAHSVNIVVNETDFGLERILEKRIEKAAGERGISMVMRTIGEEYRVARRPEIARLERELFSRETSQDAAQETPRETARETSPGDVGGEKSTSFSGDTIRLVECANQYFEAENAAAHILWLLRDRGLRMRDISVISNYPEGGQSIIKRTFREYGLPLFIDGRRGISDSQAAVFVVSQLEAVARDHQTAAMLALVKNSLSGFSRARWEELENYVRDFGIKGSMWTRPFKYGEFKYEEGELKALEETRAQLMDKLAPLEALVASRPPVKDFIDGYAAYLEESWDFTRKMEGIIRRQQQAGENEEAERSEGSYNGIFRILDQIGELTGDDPLDIDSFVNMLKEGLANTNVGLLPPAADGLSLGTAIRTRTGQKKAVVILGANEGMLPMEPAGEGLFSPEDKKVFSQFGLSIGGLDEVKQLEERAALYRAVSKPSEELYISWSLAGADGGESRASSVIEQIRELFPGIKVEKDVVQRGFSMDLVAGEEEALRHMLNRLKQRPSEKGSEEGKDGDELVHQVMAWFEENRPELMERVTRTLEDDNSREPVSQSLAKRLYARGGDFSFSASRLDRFFACPFAHFVSYGLKPQEEQEFRSAANDIGDIYHQCIMEVSRRIMEEKQGSSGTGTVPVRSEENLRSMVDSELDRLAKDYKGGLFLSAGREQYRMERIREICLKAVEAIAEQIDSGHITEAFFEEKFGRGCTFEPVVFTLNGQKVYIEGKIDRVDVLDDRGVRVIDYKTGNEELDLNNMRQGYKLQLMVYLQSAAGTGEDGSSAMEPAGMFYFRIADQNVSANGKDSQKAVSDAERNRFKLQGAYVEDGGIPDMMPREALDKKSAGLSGEDFRQLELDVRKELEKISTGIVTGDISISPFFLKKEVNGCRYCNYRTICRFEQVNRGNSYRVLKRPEKKRKKKED